MAAVCVLVAGIAIATLREPEFTLAWTHSVAKTRWEERYRVDGDALRLVEAYVEGSGAGMEPPDAAVRAGAGWRWSPDRRVESLTLAGSAHGGDYTLCAAGRCSPLPAGPAVIQPCAVPANPRP